MYPPNAIFSTSSREASETCVATAQGCHVAIEACGSGFNFLTKVLAGFCDDGGVSFRVRSVQFLIRCPLLAVGRIRCRNTFSV